MYYDSFSLVFWTVATRGKNKIKKKGQEGRCNLENCVCCNCIQMSTVYTLHAGEWLGFWARYLHNLVRKCEHENWPGLTRFRKM